jgi:hypothetical protein
MEKKMSKSLVILGSAVLATALTASVSTAEARGGGRGFHFSGGGGGGARIARVLHVGSAHHHRYHRRIYVASPVYTETYKVARPVVIQPAPAGIRYADGLGRVYDLASKVWFDGDNRCWSGTSAWTFKSGAWFYGSYPWVESEGTWRTSAPDAPVQVACDTVPAFAGKFAPTVSQTDGQKVILANPSQGSGAGEPKPNPKPMAPPVKTVEKRSSGEPAKLEGTVVKAGECKKYFANIGEMLTVPCNS